MHNGKINVIKGHTSALRKEVFTTAGQYAQRYPVNVPLMVTYISATGGINI